MNKYKLSLILCSFVWGFGYVAMDVLVTESNPIWAVTSRFMLAALVSFIVSYKVIIKEFKQAFKPTLVIGVTLFIAFLFQAVGLANTTTSKNAFLTASCVVWTPIIISFIKRVKLPTKIYIASVIMLIGIGFISLDKAQALNIGDILTLVGAVFFAMHMITIDHYSKIADIQVIVFGQLLVVSVLGLTLSIVTNSIYVATDPLYLGALIFAGVLSTALCFFLQNYGIKHVDTSTAGIILSLESLFGVLAASTIGGEVLGISAIIGFIIMFSGIILAERG